MENVPPPLPSWFVVARRIFIATYIGVAVLIVASVFIMGAIGLLVYRDFTSYSLAGNPWEPSSFPWYVIDGMRLMTIVGGMGIAALGFFVFYSCITFVSFRIIPPRSGLSVGRRLVVAMVSVAAELALAAWLGRWFG
jgi:hypothetical protein